MKILTERLEIVPLCLDELRAIMKSKADFDKISNCKVSGIEIPATYCEELSEMIDRIPEVWNNKSTDYIFFTLWAIIDRKSREFIGQFTFNGLPGPNGEVEVFFSIESNNRKKGYATEVMLSIFKWASETGLLKVILIEADLDNRAAMVSLKKLGFKPLPANYEDDEQKENRSVTTKYYKKIQPLNPIDEELDFD